MTDIGRNELCPCRSGKKYKNCCLKNQEMINFFKETLESQYIDGNYVINNLLSESSILAEFLISEAPNLRNGIIWLYNPKLNAQMRSIGSENANGIIVRELPIPRENYFEVAHEVGHIILAEQGYPMTRIYDNDNKKTYLGTILSNTILDPLVNRYVCRYGFDFQQYMTKAFSIQIPMIERYPDHSFLHNFDKFFLICLAVEKIQDWKLVSKEESQFEIRFKNKYPLLYNEANEIVKEIENFKNITPTDARTLLIKIRQRYSMDSIIEIV